MYAFGLSGLLRRQWFDAFVILLQVGQGLAAERPRRGRPRIVVLGKADRPEHDATRHLSAGGVDVRKGGAEQQREFAAARWPQTARNPLPSQGCARKAPRS